MLELILSSALIISSRSPCTCTRSILPPCPTTGCEVEERHLEIAQPTKNNFFTVAKTKIKKNEAGNGPLKRKLAIAHTKKCRSFEAEAFLQCDQIWRIFAT